MLEKDTLKAQQKDEQLLQEEEQRKYGIFGMELTDFDKEFNRQMEGSRRLGREDQEGIGTLVAYRYISG